MGLIAYTDIKTEVNMAAADTTYDALLTLIAAAIQSIFDEMTGRTSESTAHTEYYSTERGQSKVFLNNWPVTSVASLYDDPDWDYGADDLVDSDDYTTDLVRGIIKYTSYFQEGFNNIKVTYTAGYTAETFPASWKQIWTRQAAHWFKEAKTKQYGLMGITLPGGSISKAVLKDNLLEDFRMLVEMERRANV